MFYIKKQILYKIYLVLIDILHSDLVLDLEIKFKKTFKGSAYLIDTMTVM